MLKKIGIYLILLLFIAYFTAGCFSNDNDPVTISRFLMDTKVDLTFYELPQDKANELAEEVFAEMTRLEELLSIHQEGSDIDNINRHAGIQAVEVSPATFEILEKFKEIAQLTDGAFDVTIAPVLQLWGFGQEEQAVPGAEQLEEALKLVDYKDVSLEQGGKVRLAREGMMLDLGGIAKGYIVDRGLAVLEEKGVETAFLNAGGDINILGSKPDGSPWKVGIQDPDREEGLLAIMHLDGGAVATSGNYERFFEEDGYYYHHILDPTTGYPTEGLAGATVVADDCLTADALSTAVFVLGLEEGLKFLEDLPQTEGLLIADDGEIAYTSGLEGQLEFRD